MENFVLQLTTNPALYIGYALATVGAVGILIFCAGFFGALSHLFTYSESADHMEHARTRGLWGLYLSMVALGLWQIVRLILGEADSSSLILIAILLSPMWIPWIKGLLTGSSGGH